MNNYNYVKVFLILILFTSCSFVDRKKYYVNCLNNLHVSQDILNKNYVGMTRRQIIYIFGEPIISDDFSDVYRYYICYKKTKNTIKKGMLNFYFENNKVRFFNIQ